MATDVHNIVSDFQHRFSAPYSRRQGMTVLCPTAEWCSYMIHQHHHCSYAPSEKLLRMATLNPSAQCCMMTSVYPAAECCMTSAMLQLRRIVLRSLAAVDARCCSVISWRLQVVLGGGELYQAIGYSLPYLQNYKKFVVTDFHSKGKSQYF